MGTIIEFNDLKVPDPLAGQPPWRDSRWLAAAEGWIDAECARAVEQVGLSRRSPTVRALTASYLSPWLEAGYGRAAVDRSLSLALRIAPLARALTWGRLFPCYLGHPALAIHAARALAAVLESDPLGVGPLTSGS